MNSSPVNHRQIGLNGSYSNVQIAEKAGIEAAIGERLVELADEWRPRLESFLAQLVEGWPFCSASSVACSRSLFRSFFYGFSMD